ncbi:TetR/AcrR family transcriptional regulator [Halobellus inordinatus]|uniref:TetR/AcrR family transcriptional regulator n=1 Tax=Halobellus inordinatus TaxID=1126236 RepID=UPI00210AAA78|nr:TetR/AcrR family transcriptional regulator [Halobellus inordinatus]
MTTETATQILHATHSALCKHGYAELTMQDIADETDLCKASIHYHYDGKHDLLVAYLDHLYEQFEDRIAEPAGETPAERLRGLVVALVTDRSDAPAFQTALLEIKAQSPYDDAFRSRLQRFDHAFTAAVREVVAEGVADGTFHEEVDPDAVASFLTTYVNGAQTRHAAVGHPLDDSAAAVDAYIDEALRADQAASTGGGPSSETANVGGTE